MRYFQTSNASRPYKAGGFAFEFEPIQQIGGSWLGVAAVEDDSVAAILAAAGFPQVKEITAEEYDAQKKKASKPSQSSSARRELPPPHLLNHRPPQEGAVLVEGTSMFRSNSPRPPAAAAVKPAPMVGRLIAEIVDVIDELRLAGEVGPRAVVA